MNVLSLFDGMSCGQIALERVGVKVSNYYASEIDKYAMKVAKANYPNTIHIGDVTQVKASSLPKIDLIIGGSPCQGFSFAGKQLNFDDPRSKLFFEMVRLIKECKPKYFFLENVRMKQESKDVISELLGVEPVEVNSALVSAQSRRRLYWTNIPGFKMPSDTNTVLKDIIETNPRNTTYLSQGTIKRFIGYGVPFISKETVKARCHGAMEYVKNGKQGNYLIHQINPSKEAGKKQPHMQNRVFHTKGKSHSLTASFANRTNIGESMEQVRKLTPVECERLQTVPDNYTDHVSNTQRYKMLGNGWTIDVITEFFKGLKECLI